MTESLQVETILLYNIFTAVSGKMAFFILRVKRAGIFKVGLRVNNRILNYADSINN